MSDVTVILERMVDGDSAAERELLPLVYEHLRALAGSFFRAQRADHTLQPTALVHEAYLKLVAPADHRWKNREHFLAVAATAMRQILHDHARRRKALKRGGDNHQVTLADIATPSGDHMLDIIALDEVLGKLASLDKRQARIVELRFFGGLTTVEIAKLLDLSTRTIEKDWRRVRAWLSAELASFGD